MQEFVLTLISIKKKFKLFYFIIFTPKSALLLERGHNAEKSFLYTFYSTDIHYKKIKHFESMYNISYNTQDKNQIYIIIFSVQSLKIIYNSQDYTRTIDKY